MHSPQPTGSIRLSNLVIAFALALCGPKSELRAQSARPFSKDERAYYKKWVGVPAPAIGPTAQLGMNGPRITIEEFRGKRLLLFSFDSGNFVGGGRPIEQVAEELNAVNKAVSDAGADRLAAVGFTEGTEFFFPEDGLSEPMLALRRLPKFPLAPITNRHFKEPYSMLLRPGGIVIDRNGIIIAVYPRPMNPDEIAATSRLPDWSGPTQTPPLQDPWEGKEPPMPTRSFVRQWRKTIPSNAPNPMPSHRSPVIALGHGDWNRDGRDDILAINADGVMRVLDSDGKLQQEFTLPGRPNYVAPVIICAELKPTVVAAFQHPEGWPSEIPLISSNGRSVWTYGPTGAGIDSAAFADLDGDGKQELIVGYNGGAGLHVVSCDDERRWHVDSVANVWQVAGLDARGGRPGLVLCTSARGEITVFDNCGKLLRRIPNSGNYVTNFAVAEVNPQGDRQVLASWRARAGAPDFVVATDTEGNQLWKYPAQLPRRGPKHGALQAGELAGDGTKQWIIATAEGDLIVLDAAGKLLARLAQPGGPPACWTAVRRPNDTGLLIVSDTEGLDAYSLADR